MCGIWFQELLLDILEIPKRLPPETKRMHLQSQVSWWNSRQTRKPTTRATKLQLIWDFPWCQPSSLFASIGIATEKSTFILWGIHTALRKVVMVCIFLNKYNTDYTVICRWPTKTDNRRARICNSPCPTLGFGCNPIWPRRTFTRVMDSWWFMGVHLV